MTLVVQMIDEASGEIINGAIQTGTSAARVGFTADDDALILEAINNAAFLAVKTMVDYIIPEATVMMNIGESQVMLNKGGREGLKPGMRMIVLREKEIIGYIEIRSVSPQDSVAKVVKSMRGIQPQDRTRAIFEMPAVSSALKTEPLPSGAPNKSGTTQNSLSKIAKFVVGAAIVLGLAMMFRGGRGSESAPSVAASATNPCVITWNPSLYGHGQNVLQYQVLRDVFLMGAAPIMVVSDPSAVDAGAVSIYPLYGTGQPTTVSYDQLHHEPGHIVCDGDQHRASPAVRGNSQLSGEGPLRADRGFRQQRQLFERKQQFHLVVDAILLHSCQQHDCRHSDRPGPQQRCCLAGL